MKRKHRFEDGEIIVVSYIGDNEQVETHRLTVRGDEFVIEGDNTLRSVTPPQPKTQPPEDNSYLMRACLGIFLLFVLGGTLIVLLVKQTL